ncbi:AraC family transcriptional regulator [Pseudomonas marginalis ICMP 9505]|nr:AraC family transcriptional regulator [Pseudomonas marginalis ICMP 9505]
MAILYPPRSLQAQERFSYWNEVVCATYCLTKNRTLSDAPFDGQLKVNTLGDILLTHISSAPIEYERNSADADGDDFFLCLTLSTEAELEQCGRRSLQQCGDIVLFNSAQPYRCAFPRGDDQIVISIPRGRLINHLPRPEALVSRTLDGGSSLGRLAGNMLLEVFNAGAQEARAGERLSGALLDVVATAFEGAFGLADVGHSSRHAALLMKAKGFLLANLDDPALDLASIAHAIHVSPRALSRLFAMEGTTATRWLWQQRLQACRAALLKGKNRSISDVALSVGFTNMAHFSRAFKAAFGVSPSVFCKNN